MPDGEVVAFSAASFVCALFVLEFGADKFIDHTAIVARRTGVSQTIIALLTAGAEWEELAVVVFSIAHHRPSLALGNVVGSTISNILGAFSLGLLFHKDETAVFDRSSRLYSLLLVAITSLAAALLSFGRPTAWKAFGGISIGLFVIYVFSIAWAISKGRIAAPELSDSDDSDSEVDDAQGNPPKRASVASRQQGDASVEHLREPLLGNGNAQNTTRPVFSRSSREETFSPGSPATELPGSPAQRPLQHSLTYHVGLLLVGFIALLVSAYVLSQAASTLATEFAISDVLFGIIILSIATTIPEKFIAAVSGSRGHMGIMVANTVGSNIFLLTLCMGIIFMTTDGEMIEDSINRSEIGVMLGSTVWMTFSIWYGARWARYTGAAMLAAYIVFIVLEFTLLR